MKSHVSLTLLPIIFYYASVFVTQTNGRAVISLLGSLSVVVQRPGQFSLQISKTGTSATAVTVIIQLVSTSSTTSSVNDFIGTSLTLQFVAGSDDSIQLATFTVPATSLPTPDRTYRVQMTVTAGDAVISQSQLVTVTVAAKNDPYGVFGFLVQSPLSLSINATTSSFPFVLQRSMGSFSNVTVFYQVLSRSQGIDVKPSSGSVWFPEGNTTTNLVLEVLADQISSDNETFTVTLTSVSGDTVSVNPSLNSPRLNATMSQLTVFIRPTAAAVRLSETVYVATTSTFYMTIYRGLSADGNVRLGPVNSQASIDYLFSQATAVLGVDFSSSNGTVSFSSGATSNNISINILVPTTSGNNFVVLLSNPTGNVFLAAPSSAMVTINASRGLIGWRSAGVAVIDVGQPGRLLLDRIGGVYGTATVTWSLALNSSTVSGDGVVGVGSTSGNALLSDGTPSTVVTLTVVTDTGVPRTVQVCRVSLTSVQGATLVSPSAGFRDTYVVIADSGSAYGIFNFFRNNCSLVVDSNGRRLQLALTRDGGTNGDVDIALNASLSGSSGVPSLQLVTTMPRSQAALTATLTIPDTLFIVPRAQFVVTLQSVNLRPAIPFGPYHSPAIGSTSSVSISVGQEAANGDVSIVNAPSSPVMTLNYGSTLLVQIARTGSYGNVTVDWNIVAQQTYTTSIDQLISPLNGSVSFQSGQLSSSVSLKILPVNSTQLSGQYVFQLVNVVPATMATINLPASSLLFNLPDFGNPGGVFSFSPSMNASYTIAVETDVISVTVIRTGSALASIAVQYNIVPNGNDKFYGGASVLYFQPGQTSITFPIIAIDDGVPQLNVTYQLRLSFYGTPEHQAAISDTNNVINITVLAANYPYGFFSFPSQFTTSTVYLNKSTNTYKTSLLVQRLKGAFSVASVDWFISGSSDVLSLQPTNGTLTFPLGQSQTLIWITVIGNNMPQFLQNFTVFLNNPTGLAQLGPHTNATISVVGTDYAVAFNDTTVRMLISSQRSVFITRDGPLKTNVSVRYQTLPGTAQPMVNYVPINDTIVTFGVGEQWKPVQIASLDGNKPVPDLTFYVVLYDAIGDIVVTSNLTVIITAHGKSNGVFRFVPPFSQSVYEGDTVNFQLVRDFGIYGRSTVRYQISFANPGTPSYVTIDQLFGDSVGSVVFNDLQYTETMSLTVLQSGRPHFNVYLTVQLTNVTGGPASDPGLLAATNLLVNLIVLPANNPYGVYLFADDSLAATVAELSQSTINASVATSAELNVTKSSGAPDYVPDPAMQELVLWEVYSFATVGPTNLPSATDLLSTASAKMSSSVPTAPTQRRTGTGTNVFRFNGCQACYLNVSIPNPTTSRTSVINSFTLTAWFKSIDTQTPPSGCLLSKQSNDSSVLAYSLCLSPQRSVLFAYGSNSQIVNVSTSPVSGLSDGLWHFVLVEITSTAVTLMLDSNVLTNVVPVSTGATNYQPGTYLIGMPSITNADQYVGFLQDVRIYWQTLNANQKLELYNLPSSVFLSPVSGYLTFTVGFSRQAIAIQTLDTGVPQPARQFAVRLVSSSGLTPVSSTNAMSTITELKSYYANGLFGFNGPCRPSAASMTDSQFLCSVQRSLGTYDSVVVQWLITSSPSSNANYFANSTGSVVFLPGVTQMTISLPIINDGLPRFTEYFTIALTTATPGDGLTGPTATSGAVIDAANARNTLTVLDYNYPNGLLQFTSLPLAIALNSSRILPASVQPQVTVPVGADSVSLTVVRAQGLTGQISAEWKTIDGTAKSAGKIPPDFVAGAGLITLQNGERYSMITVRILSSNSTDGARSFQVTLLNPNGGAALGVGSTVTVVIQPTTQSYGIFQFADQSLSNFVTVNNNSPTIQTTLSVLRLGGSYGNVSLTWMVFVATNQSNFQPMYGTVVVADGLQTASVTISMANDMKPTLDTQFFAQLVNVSQGSLGDSTKLRANVTVLAHNDPYGVFVISATSRLVFTQSITTVIPVSVERQSASGLFGTVSVSYSTLSPTEYYSYLPTLNSSQVRADYLDFSPTSGVVTFLPGQTTVTFNISINMDVRSRPDAVFFARLVSVTLVLGEQPRTVSNSPRLGDNSLTFTTFIIAAHGYPNGILQFSNASVEYPSSYQGVLLYIVRSAGLVGSVTVKLQALAGSAQPGVDYVMTSDRVTFADGVASLPVPVTLINNAVPSLQRSFTIVMLNDTIGGAVVGSLSTATVVIQKTFDANGIFGFTQKSMTLNGPPDGQTRQLSVQIQRSGGTFGIVELMWNVSSNGLPVANSIQPVSGIVYFVSSAASQNLIVSILPVNLMDGYKDLRLNLLSANGGGLINREMSSLAVNVLPNSNPYGTVGFLSGNYSVSVPPALQPQFIRLMRTVGTFGDVRIQYQTAAVDILQQATSDGSTVYSYFQPPLAGTPLPLAAIDGTNWNVMGFADQRLACGRLCLMSQSCQSFAFNQRTVDCVWFTQSQYQYIDNRTGYQYYIKDPIKAKYLYGQLAFPGVDYTEVTGANVTMANGINQVDIPMYILPNTIPELTKRLTVNLTGIELASVDVVGNPNYRPLLGGIITATVFIEANNNPHGSFAVYISGQSVVSTKLTRSVLLNLNREDGTYGVVSVAWFVISTITTAQYGVDYIADGATMTFGEGESLKAVTITILDSGLPSNDRVIAIGLRNANGGAVINPVNNTVTITLMAQNHVAGLFSFNATQYPVKEGETFPIAILRSQPAAGNVTLFWQLASINNRAPSERFSPTVGQMTFVENELQKTVSIQTLITNQPAIDDSYMLSLVNITTTGVRSTGAAAADPASSVAMVTIAGGNQPHGVFSFNISSIETSVQPSNNSQNLTVVRQSGAIGIVRVYYSIFAGYLYPPTGGNTILATPGVSFVAINSSFVSFADGQTAATITVTILKDAVPRPDQVLVVNLTNAELVTTFNQTFYPVLASTGTTAQVTIMASPGALGTVLFTAQYASMVVESISTTLSIVIHRNDATFGTVSVFCYAQSVQNGASLNGDFSFQPQVVYFGPGVTDQTVTATIFSSNIPKPDRQFEIVLSNPSNGLLIGNPGKAVVTILATNQAAGIVNFDTTNDVDIAIPIAGQLPSLSKATIRIVRGPGVFGIVNVPFLLVSLDNTTGQAVTHLTPSSGVLTFLDQQAFTLLDITAVGGVQLTSDEHYAINLMSPNGGAVLGTAVTRRINLLRSSSPSGVMQLFVAGSRDNSLTVEAVQQTVYLDVVRSFGTIGVVSVDVVTQSASAVGQPGPTMYLSAFQQVSNATATRWYSFTAYNWTYVLAMNGRIVGPLTTVVGSRGTATVDQTNGSPTTLYRWQGSLNFVQTIETDGVQSAKSFVIGNDIYLFVANGGSSGRYQTTSRLYQVASSGQLTVVQDISTQGASDAEFIAVSDSLSVLVVTNYWNNNGLTTGLLSAVYRWDDSQKQFTNIQYLSTVGALAVQSLPIGSVNYVVVANGFDSTSQSTQLSSNIYKVNSDGTLTLYQRLSTRRAVDVTAFTSTTTGASSYANSYVAVANNRDNTGNLSQTVDVYVWNNVLQQFQLTQAISANNAQHIYAFRTADGGPVLLAVANGAGSTVIYRMGDNGQFISSWQGSATSDFYPFIIKQTIGNLALVADAPPPTTSSTTSSVSTVWQISMIGPSDFIPSAVTVSFLGGQTSLRSSVAITYNPVPGNKLLTFYVKLDNPQNGAILSTDAMVTVNILPVGNPCGLVQFSQDSVTVPVAVSVLSTTSVQLNVSRLQGTRGHAVIKWQASSANQATIILTPTSGNIDFADGQSVSTIDIDVTATGSATVSAGVVYVTLTDVLYTNSSTQSCSTSIGSYQISEDAFLEQPDSGPTALNLGISRGIGFCRSNNVATLSILVNGWSYGSISWSSTSYAVSRPNLTASYLTAYIVRSGGTVGPVTVFYRTGTYLSAPVDQQAIAGLDYVGTSSSVDITSASGQVPVQITILPNANPELSKSFVLNVTSVTLLGSISNGKQLPTWSPQASDSTVSTVTIAEHGISRGVVQFNVSRNVENRLDFNEGSTATLPVFRSSQSSGAITVIWQTVAYQATSLDYRPTSGNITFSNNQLSGYIQISLNSDAETETLETFEVQLTSVLPAGRATVGIDDSVRIGIMHTTSSSGVFSIFPQRQVVRKSADKDDPNGSAEFTVVRSGVQGTVTVYWTLEPQAASGFYQPIYGSLFFQNGAVSQPLTIQSLPSVSGVLIGEQSYQLQLTFADNNAVVSPSQGRATIVIEADVEISGIVQISTDSNLVVFGQAVNGSYIDGRIKLVRGAGKYGTVSVAWQVLSTDSLSSVLVQSNGLATFADLQDETTITLQALANTSPSLRRTYVLQLISATGGAALGSTNATQATVVLVASGYPRGMFVMSGSPSVSVSRNQTTVNIDVSRLYGSAGQVRVFYTTVAGAAKAYPASSDGLFSPSSGWLTYVDGGLGTQTLSVSIFDNGLPQGPMQFYVNLTQIELVQPTTDNYAVSDGLRMDQPPVIGTSSTKTIVILPRPDAAGTIQLTTSAITVFPDQGVVSLGLARGPGSYGTVSVYYTTTDMTAKLGIDYFTGVQPVQVVMADSMTSAAFNISLANDGRVQPAKQFVVNLLNTAGGALLGSNRVAIVTVARSGYPNGKFGFTGSPLITLNNPATLSTVSLSVARTGGSLGQQAVTLCVMGPNNASLPLTNAADVGLRLQSSTSAVTSAILTWNDGDSSSKSFSLLVQPYVSNVWEIEKTYVISICNISGTPATTGDGDVSWSAGSVTVNHWLVYFGMETLTCVHVNLKNIQPHHSVLSTTNCQTYHELYRVTGLIEIKKYGTPNGVIGFDGVALAPRAFQVQPTGILTVVFPVTRTLGSTGRIEVYYTLIAPSSRTSSDDLLLTFTTTSLSGVVVMPDGVTTGQITIGIKNDGLSTLTEQYQLLLASASGGADIDTSKQTSSFSIQYRGFPHGQFSIDPNLQSIAVNPSSFQRQLIINVTRGYGAYGRVRVDFAIVYNQAVDGVVYVPTTSFVLFNDGDSVATTAVDINNGASLSVGSTFKVTLTSATYIGDGGTIPPSIVSGSNTALISVAAAVANSVVQFSYSVATVDDVSGMTSLTLARTGVYGAVTVRWRTSDQSVPTDVAFGTISPSTGSINFVNGQQEATFSIQPLLPQTSSVQLYAVYLTSVVASVAGGATLSTGQTTCVIEPYGVFQFAQQTRQQYIDGTNAAGPVQVSLVVERLYGYQSNVVLTYRLRSLDSDGNWDNALARYSTITMTTVQTSAIITVQIDSAFLVSDVNYFNVSLTDASLPDGSTVHTLTQPSAACMSECPGISPRVSSVHSTASIQIKGSSVNVEGVFSITSQTAIGGGKVLKPASVSLLVTRTGGSYGPVSVRVRTVGGGEVWDDLIDLLPALSNNDTIAGVLSSPAATNPMHQSTVGVDYTQLDTTLLFSSGQTDASCTLNVLNNTAPSDDKFVYVFITVLSSVGVIARPSVNNGLQGYVVVTVLKNNFVNGWIGFDESSLIAQADWSTQQPLALLLKRQSSAPLGQLTVYWRTVDPLSPRLTAPVDLSSVLETTAGSVTCPMGEQYCTLNVRLINNQIPMNATWFQIQLYLGPQSSQAAVDPTRSLCNVSLPANNFPNGLIEFAASYRSNYVDQNATSVQLQLTRSGFSGKSVMVTYMAQQTQRTIDAGIQIYAAVEGVDFTRTVQAVTFDAGQTTMPISVTLNPSFGSSGTNPRRFQIVLLSASSLAQIGVSAATVTMVNSSDVDLWNAWKSSGFQQNNGTLTALSNNLADLVKPLLSMQQLTIVKATLDQLNVLAQSRSARWSANVQNALMSVYCVLLQDGRQDATRGHWPLFQRFLTFAMTIIDQSTCSTNQLVTTCSLVTVQLYRMPAVGLSGLEWTSSDGNGLTLPNAPLQFSSANSSVQCVTVAMMEFSTEQWFTSSQSDRLLSSKVLTVNLDNEQLQAFSQKFLYHIAATNTLYAPRSSRCAYYDGSSQSWSTGSGSSCYSTNNVVLGIDRNVQCSCRSWADAYAVVTDLSLPGSNVGYTIWFAVSCFVTILAMLMIILTHRIGADVIKPLFPATLHTHLCFAVLATQVCYVIDTFISPSVLLVNVAGDNGECITMSVLLHYFYLAQFSCIIAQSLNLHAALILNDDHTERHNRNYVIFCWGLPAIYVGLFYLTTYLIYQYTTRLPVQTIYGDVTGTGEICFITNIFAAIGGLIGPSVIVVFLVTCHVVYLLRLSLVWQFTTSIYSTQTNLTEVKLLITFWTLMSITYVWAGFHMAYQQLWLLILLCIFNYSLAKLVIDVIERMGIYAFIAYVLIRLPPCIKRLQQEQESTHNLLKSNTNGHRLPDSARPAILQPDLIAPSIADSKRDDLSRCSTFTSAVVEEPAADNANEENHNRWTRRQQPTLQVHRATPAAAAAVSVNARTPVLRRNTAPSVLAVSVEFDDVIRALEPELPVVRNQSNGRLTTRLNRHNSLDRELTEISFSAIADENIMSLLPADVLERQWVDITDTVV